MQVIKNVRYEDNRGYFSEVQRFEKGKNSQVSISKSKKGVIRGIHISPFEKYVKCIQGKILDVCVNIQSGKVDTLMLEENDDKTVYIPSHHGHGFLCLEDCTVLYVFTDHYKESLEYSVNPLCKELGINWGEMSNIVISEKDSMTPSLSETRKMMGGITEEKPLNHEYFIIGSSGLIGSFMCDTLEKQGKTFYKSKSRIEDFPSVFREISDVKPFFVINCAGLTGKPNIDWCDDNPEQTVFINVVGQINVAEACRRLGLHCTLFTSGIIYDSRCNRQEYKETDIPNFTDNVYCKLRILEEQLLDFYKNVLSLRILYPIAKDYEKYKGSLISKLTRFETITDIPSSYTVMDDLFPLMSEMCIKNITGVFNFSNPGVITNKQILDILGIDKKVQDISSPSSKRSCPILNVDKLLSYFPNIPTVKESLEKNSTKILVFGSNGMLGSYISDVLEKYYKVVRIIRKEFDIYAEGEDEKELKQRTEILIRKYNPGFIVNCSCIIRPTECCQLYTVNSVFPRLLQEVCISKDIYMIQPSTDGIYSGLLEQGKSYEKNFIPDAKDDYGKSKYEAEKSLSNKNTCIIRTSIIGLEKDNKRSLLSWVFSNKGGVINGYTNHYWNGITCLEYAKFIYKIIKNIRKNNITRKWEGVFVIGSTYKNSDCITKYDLIKEVSNIFGLNCVIKPVETFTHCNRVLQTCMNIQTPDIVNQLMELKNYHNM
jgi:3,5-epimerase/4-reductase